MHCMYSCNNHMNMIRGFGSVVTYCEYDNSTVERLCLLPNSVSKKSLKDKIDKFLIRCLHMFISSHDKF